MVRAAKGKVRLVKINIDQNPELAQQLRIQSVPTVYAFVGGQPVTGFAGAQPESQIKALVDRLIGGGGVEDEAAAASRRRRSRGRARRHPHGRAPVPADPAPRTRPARGASAGSPAASIAERKFDDAAQLLDEAPKEAAAHAAVAGAKAALAAGRGGGRCWAIRRRCWRGSRPTRTITRPATSWRPLLFLRGQVETAMEHLMPDREARPRLAGRPGAASSWSSSSRRSGPSTRRRSRAAGCCPPCCSAEGTMARARRRACPSRFPIFPLRGALLLPGGNLPLNIFEPRYLQMVRDAMQTDRVIGMVQPKRRGRTDGPRPPVFQTGCAGRISNFAETDDGRLPDHA